MSDCDREFKEAKIITPNLLIPHSPLFNKYLFNEFRGKGTFSVSRYFILCQTDLPAEK